MIDPSSWEFETTAAALMLGAEFICLFNAEGAIRFSQPAPHQGSLR
jgi:hypothetical protein